MNINLVSYAGHLISVDKPMPDRNAPRLQSGLASYLECVK